MVQESEKSVMFPDKRYSQIAVYAAEYFAEISRAAGRMRMEDFTAAAQMIGKAMAEDRTIFACGNGGSAAISNHLLCDFSKGIHTHTDLHPRVVSLSSHVELITAIGNDISFEEIFAFQLRLAARPGDVLLTISSSGNSENIVHAVEWARANQIGTIAITGFEGGRSAGLADINIHTPSSNYGVVEDLHQSVMHILAQFIRMQNIPLDVDVIGKF